MKPALLVIDAPNVAGKTMETARLRKDDGSDGMQYLNPDDMACDGFGDRHSPDVSGPTPDARAAGHGSSSSST